MQNYYICFWSHICHTCGHYILLLLLFSCFYCCCDDTIKRAVKALLTRCEQDRRTVATRYKEQRGAARPHDIFQMMHSNLYICIHIKGICSYININLSSACHINFSLHFETPSVTTFSNISHSNTLVNCTRHTYTCVYRYIFSAIVTMRLTPTTHPSPRPCARHSPEWLNSKLYFTQAQIHMRAHTHTHTSARVQLKRMANFSQKLYFLIFFKLIFIFLNKY